MTFGLADLVLSRKIPSPYLIANTTGSLAASWRVRFLPSSATFLSTNLLLTNGNEAIAGDNMANNFYESCPQECMTRSSHWCKLQYPLHPKAPSRRQSANQTGSKLRGFEQMLRTEVKIHASVARDALKIRNFTVWGEALCGTTWDSDSSWSCSLEHTVV